MEECVTLFMCFNTTMFILCNIKVTHSNHENPTHFYILYFLYFASARATC